MSRRLLVSYFGDETDILGATRAARENGYEIVDVYSPFAVHGLDDAAGLKPSRLPWICFFLGLSGALAKLWFQIWTSATSWPINVGGKPLESVPAFVPVTFEIMVLFAAVGTVIAFLVVSRLTPGKVPKYVYKRVTNDRFALVLDQDDAGFDLTAVRELFAPHHLLETEERIEEPDAPRRRGSLLTKPALSYVLFLATAVIVVGTFILPRTFTEPNNELIPEMVDAVSFDPFSSNPNFPDGKTLRVPVKGTVARGFLPYDSSRADMEAAAVSLTFGQLPPEKQQENADRAALVFSTFCQPCHGAGGQGDGIIPAHGYPPPPSLEAANAVTMTDGQMFNMVTYGKGNMPSLGHRISSDDRWLAVRHVRHIQAEAEKKVEALKQAETLKRTEALKKSDTPKEPTR